MNLFVAFLLTFLIESLIYSLFIKKAGSKLIFYVTFNLFLITEFFVFLVEIPLIALLFRLKFGKAILISLISNLASGILFFFI